MKSKAFKSICLAVASLFYFGPGPSAFAASPDVTVKATSLGQIIVDGKGMTAYYYDLDVPNSGVSTCTGGCLTHWPLITAAGSSPVVVGIEAKVSVIASSNQIEINGRPIYTFAGDAQPGDTHGQGAGGVWFVVSPAGLELTPAALASQAGPSPSASTESTMPTSKATPSTSAKPKSSSAAQPSAPAKVVKKPIAKVIKKPSAKPTKRAVVAHSNY